MSDNCNAISRRLFIKESAAIAIGAGSLISGSTSSQLKKLNRGLSGRWNKKLNGYYSNPKEILETPKFMDVLQKELGVNLILMRHPIRYSKEILELNPLKKRNGYANTVMMIHPLAMVALPQMDNPFWA